MAYTIDLDRLRATAARAASPANRLTAPPASADPYSSFTERLEALRAAGVRPAQAFDLAEAMCLRQERNDDRIVCALECRHHRRGFCMNHRQAGTAAQLAELALMLQRCPGFAAVGRGHAE